MNTSLSADQYHLMNSILDKELEGLRMTTQSNAGDEKENRDLNKSRELTTKDFSSSFASDKKVNNSRKEPTDISNKILTNLGSDFNEPTNKSFKMQEDLLELQSKILNLEKRITTLNTTSPVKIETTIPNPPEKLYTRGTEHKNIEINDSPEGSPLGKKYLEKSSFTLSNSKGHKKSASKDRKATRKYTQEKEISSSSTERDEEEIDFKSKREITKPTASTPNGRSNKFAIEQSIKDAQAKLNMSKNQYKRPASKSRSMSRGKALQSSGGSDSGNYNEITVLNKKLMDYKKKCEDERQELIKERVKGQELEAHLERAQKKMKKMQVEIERLSKVQGDYDKLMESFEKSEYIRNQQKQLIANLNYEIEELRRENEELIREAAPYATNGFPGEEKKKKKRSKSKSKKKTLV